MKCRLLQQGCRYAEDDDEIRRRDDERAPDTFLVEPLHRDLGEHRDHTEHHTDRSGDQQGPVAAVAAGPADHTHQHHRYAHHRRQHPNRRRRAIVPGLYPRHRHEYRQTDGQHQRPCPVVGSDTAMGHPGTHRQREQQRRHQQRLHQYQRAPGQREALEAVAGNRDCRSRPPQAVAQQFLEHRCADALVMRDFDRRALTDHDPERRGHRGSQCQHHDHPLRHESPHRLVNEPAHRIPNHTMDRGLWFGG